MSKLFEDLKTVDRVSLPPGGEETLKALSRIGYDLDSALADLIDNSIDAAASRVEITFFRDNTEITAVTIADNGHGMDAAGLMRGMRFAGAAGPDPGRLGAYGMGLKTASFSQCLTVTVVSRQGGMTSAARWSESQIGSDWICELVETDAASHAFEEYCLKGRAPATGTVVIWQELERLQVGAGSDALDEFLGTALPRLQSRLGLVFHRFLADGALEIAITVRHESRSLAIPRPVRPLDPFDYRASGMAGWPRSLNTELPGVGALVLEAHIWPFGSQADGFLLGGRKPGPAGFYIYRNNRLIQTGGWNGVLRPDPDPELSLARVKIDLPPGQLDVTITKAALQVTAAQSAAFLAAEGGGATLQDYLDSARSAWRTGRRGADPAPSPEPVPGPGLPAAVRRAAVKQLAGSKPVEEISFVWESLEEGRVFDLDYSGARVLLNRDYRDAMLDGAPASGADAPYLKLLLFFTLRNEFGRLRSSKKSRATLELCNALLFEVVKTR